MARLLFWDVDTQHDFIHPDGKLYVPMANQIVPNLKRLTDHAHAHGIRIVASADDHVPEHEEISSDPDFEKTYPPHCMRGTPGQRKIPETALRSPLLVEPSALDPVELVRRVREHGGDILFHKHFFDVFTNPNVDTVLEVLDPEEILLYGVALDVCNRYAIDGLLTRRPRTRLRLVTDATRPIDVRKGWSLLEHWRERGVELIRTDDALGERVA
ncbi:MAG: cysteine hydrolase [Myxococcales bacterium]|nr:cysteine hydrolase [Myxococcales bacterium]MCZ6823899.1 cysteine hydrolase family protein [Deltaproteobacteria bacterium]